MTSFESESKAFASEFEDLDRHIEDGNQSFDHLFVRVPETPDIRIGPRMATQASNKRRPCSWLSVSLRSS